MSGGSVHSDVCVGTRLVHDGQLVEVVELKLDGPTTVAVVRTGDRIWRIALRQLKFGDDARVIPVGAGPAANDDQDTAAAILADLDVRHCAEMRAKAEHVREVLTGYRSGSAEFARSGEPREAFNATRPLEARYRAKAKELAIAPRTVKRWVAQYHRFGEAGLASSRTRQLSRVDQRWVDEALQVMVDHTERSRPTRSAVIRKTRLRCVAKYGDGVVPAPSRAVAYRQLAQLENVHPTFRLSTTRNRDIADRTRRPYGKIRVTRPGETVYMDTTRLDVFALDPVTLRWVQVELTVALDACTGCVLGLRVTPVSTKSVDAAAVLFQLFRPPPAGEHWPDHAVWPDHGIPRSVLIDPDAIDRAPVKASGPAVVPGTIVVDHGKIFISEHLTSVCARMGISIQPARIRTGRDKGQVERFFRTIRDDLLQHLEGYKGPDLYSRGVDVEKQAFYYLDELDAIIRQWVAAVYHHHGPHASLVDPGLPSAGMSPAMAFEYGLARSGHLEVPRDPDLALEFLKVERRTVQHYGVEVNGRRYRGEILSSVLGQVSPYGGKLAKRWPIHVDPDDIRYVYFRDPKDRSWHTLVWEHADGLLQPLGDEALRFARRMAAKKHRFVDDRLALDELLARWSIGASGSRAERRMALRMARKDGPLSHQAASDDARIAAELAAAAQRTAADSPMAAETSDDDSDDELDADYNGYDGEDPDDYYTDALEDT